MERTPPLGIRRELRREVGFGCPMLGCANPYLEYHHFDPPWRDGEHHNPTGMVALCAEHHRKADAGAFTIEQLRALKRPNGQSVTGRFDWLRNHVLAVVGGNFYYETPTIVQFRGERVIWFNRDDQGRMLLNLRMITGSGERRLRLDDNDWIIEGAPVDFESPPSGKRIYCRYRNGDELRVEFFEFSVDDARKRYPAIRPDRWLSIEFPITAVEIQHQIGGTPYGFGPTWTKLAGVTVARGFFIRCGVGLACS